MAKTNGNNKAEVAQLLKQLEKSTDQAEKRVIRRSLRKLGHKGGLNKPKKKKKS